MGGANAGPIPDKMPEWMRRIEKRVGMMERRSTVTQASDIMGPGLGPKTVMIGDWNGEETLYNGFYASEPGALHSPNPALSWMGTNLVQPDGSGVQHVWDYKSGDVPPESWVRTFVIVGTTRMYSSWGLLTSGGGGGGTHDHTGFFPIEDYGAVQDGIADDTAELQAAATAAYNAGGGIVTFWGNPRITGPVTIWPGVSLVGIMSSLTNLTRATIKLDSPTAKIKIGNGGRGGYSGHFSINGNHTGDPTGALQYTATQQVLSDVTIDDAGGVGLWVYASQNCIISSVDVGEGDGDGVVIDGGTGGMLFERCEWMSNKGWDLRITDSAPGGHPTFGYQFGPAHNHFISCLMEDYATGSPVLSSTPGLVLIEAGTRQTFRNCGISNSSNITFTGGGVAPGGYQVVITNDKFPSTVATGVQFDSCNFNGGFGHKYPPFYVKGTNPITKNVLSVSGHTFYNLSTTIYETDGVTIGHITGDFTYSGVTALWGTLVGASWFFWRNDRETGAFYKMPDPIGAWASTFPLGVSKDSDPGARWYINNVGSMAWANGANFTPLATLDYDPTTDTARMTKLSVAGKNVRGASDSIVGVGAAVTTTPSAGGPVYTYTLTGTASIASWTVGAGSIGQEITLMVYRAGTQAMVWPSTNVRYATGAPAAPASGKCTYVHLRWVTGLSLWQEIGRSVDVSAT